MPEGDTIFRTARTLGKALTGKTVTRFESAYAQLTAANDQTPFAGQTISDIESRGKWLLIHFSTNPASVEEDPESSNPSERVLATHMLMSGSWHIYRHGERWYESRANARVILETADFVAVGFRIPVARLYTEQTLRRESKIPRLENDVLSPTFDPAAAIRRLLSRAHDELAPAILRQDVLAGVGNVFKSEICFILGLSPFRPVATVSEPQAAEIVAMAQKLLAANVLEDSADQIVTFSGAHRRTTNNANPGESLWVYGRKNQACRRCSTPIQRCLQGPNARSTYWCPICQPQSE